jgi:hypothetical protein
MSNLRLVSSLSRCAARLALCIGAGLAPSAFAQGAAPPASAAPAYEPPAPPEHPTPPEAKASAPPGTVPAPPADSAELPSDGQWVYTSQYGWVYMPYAENYTYVPANGYPFEFVYGPGWGWRWVSAPWVFSIGPAPYWGPRGSAYFAWHAHPWFGRRMFVHVGRAHHRGGGHHRFAHAHVHRR